MNNIRYVFHPVLRNRRSVSIFLVNLVAALVMMAVMGKEFVSIFFDAGVSLTRFSSGFVSLLFSPVTHLGFAAVAITLGTGFTAIYVVGPIRRMEQWLKDWDAGYEVTPLRLRGGDNVYQNIVRMMNQLREKNQSQRRPRG